jgi:hypothetical protein
MADHSLYEALAEFLRVSNSGDPIVSRALTVTISV